MVVAASKERYSNAAGARVNGTFTAPVVLHWLEKVWDQR